MATTIPVMRAKMGSTEYYQGVMSAGELVDTVGYASEIEEWQDLSIEERMQRELDKNRIAKDIVPYLQNDEDRFFGALIVDIYRGWEDVEFEQLGEVVSRLPRRYAQEAELFGFLHLPGKRRLIALDGQHRLKALHWAIAGNEDYDISPKSELSSDMVSVIFIKHGGDNRKARKIFNKVNRYAKQTSRGDNIITSEDDPLAIISRRLIREGEPLFGDLVNWKSNTLARGSKQFTTISAVYDTVATILGDELAKKEINRQQRPSDEKIDQYYVKVVSVWKMVLEGVDEYQSMMYQRESIKDKRKVSLLFKPAAQMALFRGLKKALDAGVTLEDAVEAINRITWDIKSPMWMNVMIKPDGAIDAGKDAKNLASRLIAHYISDGRVADPDLLNDYRRRLGKEGNEEVMLPDMAVPA